MRSAYLLISLLIVWLIWPTVKGENSTSKAVLVKLPDFIQALLSNNTADSVNPWNNLTALVEPAADDQAPVEISPPSSTSSPASTPGIRDPKMAHSTTPVISTRFPFSDTKSELKKKTTKISGPPTSPPPCTTPRPLVNLSGVQVRTWTGLMKLSALAAGRAGGIFITAI